MTNTERFYLVTKLEQALEREGRNYSDAIAEEQRAKSQDSPYAKSRARAAIQAHGYELGLREAISIVGSVD